MQAMLIYRFGQGWLVPMEPQSRRAPVNTLAMLVAKRQPRTAAHKPSHTADRSTSRTARFASVAFVALFAVAALAVIVPQPTDADVMTSLPGTWCNAAKKLRYDYSSIPLSWYEMGGANFATNSAAALVPAWGGYYGTQELGFPFRFFDATHSQINIFSNGLAWFGAETDYGAWQTPQAFPNSAPANSVIATLWYDWDFTEGQWYTETTGTAGNLVYNVEWTGGTKFAGAPPTGATISYPPASFELKLKQADNSIEMHVLNLPTEPASWGGMYPTIGIESALDGSWQGGLHKPYSSGSNNFAVRFVPVWDAAPTAAADTYAATQGTPLVVSAGTAPGALSSGLLYYIRTGGLLANDTDEIPCATKTAQLVTGIPAGQGTLTLATDGGFTYDPGNFCGTTSFTYRVLDPAGSAGGSIFQSGTATATINVACLPNVDPTAQCSILSVAPYLPGQLIQFSSSGSADSDGTIGTYEWTFTGGPANSGAANPSVSWTSPSAPQYTATLRVRDDDLAWSPPVSCPITIEGPDDPANLPPVAGPKAYDMPTGITFQSSGNAQGGLAAAASDPDGDPLTFSACAPLLAGLSLQSDGQFTWPTPQTPQTVTFQYQVSDGALTSACETVTMNVLPNQKPVASFSATPNPAKVGQAVSFGDLSTDPDLGDAIVEWRWKFGDGSISHERNPTHAFGATGNFQVCLMVGDSFGGWSKSYCAMLQVNPAAEEQASQPDPPAPTEIAQGQGSSSSPEAPRKLSVTIDGPSAAAPGTQVTLVANSDGSPTTSFAWQQLSGDAVLTVSGASVTFTVPADAESLFLAVTATDGADEGTLTRLIAIEEDAEAAVARIAGPNSGRTGEIIALDASASEGATSFAWVQVSGPAVTMQGAGTARPMVHLGAAGTVTLMLAADNGQGATTATHTIVVAAAGGRGTGDDGTQDGDQAGSDDSSGGSDGTSGASVGEKASGNAGGFPAWLPFAIVGFIAAFVAVGAFLLLRRRA